MSNYKQKSFFTATVLFAYLAAGCSLNPPTLSEPIVKSRSFKAPYDTTWTATIKAISASGEFVNVAQKDSGLITFQKNIPVGEIHKYALAPEGVTWHTARSNVSILLEDKGEGGSCVTVNSKIWGNGMNFWSGVPVQLEMGSRGLIEKDYLDKIAALIPGAKTYEWLEPSKPQKTEQQIQAMPKTDSTEKD